MPDSKQPDRRRRAKAGMRQRGRPEFGPGHYRNLRKKLGTQQMLADELGVTRETISMRERGRTTITREMELALRYATSDWGPSRWRTTDPTDPHTARWQPDRRKAERRGASDAET